MIITRAMSHQHPEAGRRRHRSSEPVSRHFAGALPLYGEPFRRICVAQRQVPGRDGQEVGRADA